MGEKEQTRPLAPASDHQITTSDEEETTNQLNKQQLQRKKFIRCCSYISALFLIIAITIIILIFTVFKIKGPIINLKGVTVNQLNFVNASRNLTLTAQVSVKNPNFASFKYSNTTTSLYYRGNTVGEARGPPGQAKARRTMNITVTVDVVTGRLLGNPNFQSDLSAGLLPISSYTRVGGRVKMLTFVKRHIVVKMNCSITVNVTSQEIQEQKCRRKVKL